MDFTTFYHRANPDSWLSLAPYIVMLLAFASLLLRRSTRFIPGAVAFLIGALFASAVLILCHVWPDEIRIDSSGLNGRQGWRRFAIPIADISSIETRPGSKKRWELSVHLKSSRAPVEIPIVTGERKDAYKDALSKISRGNCTLTW